MSFGIIYPFDDETNYTFDDTQVEITGGVGKLALLDNPVQEFPLPFTADTGFTYDSDLVEFTGTLMQQKDQMPTDGVIAATYDSSINANYSINSISLTGTGVNTPTIVGNKLLCTGNRGVYYNHTNLGFAGAFAIKFKYTPDFTGSPPGATDLISLHPGAGNNDNVVITLVSNTIRAMVYNNVGAIVQSMAVVGGNVTWTNGVEKEIEINVDPTAGTIKIFFDGTLHGTLSPGAWTRGTSARRLWIGANPYYGNGNGSYADVVLFNTIQHTANYTPGYTLSETRYATAIVTTPELEYTGAGTLINFDDFLATESGTPKYTIQIGRSGDYLYWSGSAWNTSNNTYSQATDSATFDANSEAAPVIGEIYGQYRVYFEASNTQSSVTLLNSILDAQVYATDTPTIIINSSFRHESILSFTEVSSKTGNDEIKYNLSKDGTYYYWDGAAWSESNGTYSQSNTSSEITTNLSSFTSVAINTVVKIFLYSDDGTTTPEIESLTITYDFAGEESDDINTCIVWGYIKDIVNELETSVIKVNLNKETVQYKDNIMIRNVEKEVIPDSSDGRFEIELIENENMEGGASYTFDFGNGRTYSKRVPNVASVSFFDL